jgi:hypothetical protein
MSQQAVSAAIIRNTAVLIFSQKQKEQRHKKQLRLIDTEMNIFTPKGFQGCVRVKRPHLATLKSNNI